MPELFQQLVAWVSLHPGWAAALIFLVAMAESVAIVGLVVPGVALMFGIGALIAAGAVDLWQAIAWAVAGAVAGDGLSFWIGRRYRGRLTAIWPFTRHPQSLNHGIRFFERYGGKSVVVGRFFGPVRAVIPLVAGMMGMSPGRFLAANIASALAWAPAYLLPGMLFGASLELAAEVAFRLVLLLLLLLGAGWLLVTLVKWLFLVLQPRAALWLEWLLRWSRPHPKAREIALALADPNHPDAKGLALFASLLLLSSLTFLLILGAVLEQGLMAGLDQLLFHGLQGLRTPWADHWMILVTRLADTWVVVVLIATVWLWLTLRHHRRTAGYWLAAGLFVLFASETLKRLIHIPRPPGVTSLASYAFPSGHTLAAVVLFGFLAVVIAGRMAPERRWVPYASATLLVLGIAFSRLYLGAHWLSDILGSLALGAAWVTALGIAYRRHTAAQPPALPLTLTALIALGASWGGYGWLRGEAEAARYLPTHTLGTIAEQRWLEDGWRQLDRYRLDTRNQGTQPMNLQFAGEPQALAHRLATRGWRSAPPFSAGELLRLLSPQLPLQQLPILPQTHRGEPPALTLFRDEDDGNRVVLRLWEGGQRLEPGGAMLWLGSVSTQERHSIIGLVAYAATAQDFDTALGRLRTDLLATAPDRLVLKPDLLLVEE